MKHPERLAIFFQRLDAAPRCSSHDQAMEQLAAILNAVEDEHSGIPANPEAALTVTGDGRMYPPHQMFRRPIRDGLVRYRTKGHSVFVRDNGAYEIRSLEGNVCFAKAGSDGEGVGEI